MEVHAMRFPSSIPDANITSQAADRLAEARTQMLAAEWSFAEEVHATATFGCYVSVPVCSGKRGFL